MTPALILGLYLLVGIACTAWALRLGQPRAIVLAMPVAWPFLGPTLRAPSAAPSRSTDAARLQKLEAALEAAWTQAASLGAGRPAERERIGRFVAHLGGQILKVEEMDLALRDAADRLRGPLAQLRARAAADVAEGLALLEELVAQLTLLRFAGGPGGEAARHEKDHVEALLARIGALAEVSSAA